jgi:hypothetical protein
MKGRYLPTDIDARPILVEVAAASSDGGALVVFPI